MAKKESKCKKCVCKLIGWGLLLGLGVGLIVFGVFSLQRNLLRVPYEMYIKERFALRPHSEALYNWAGVYKDHVTHNYYFFNVTNYEEVIEYGARPTFAEVGPYTYKVHRRRDNIYFDVARREKYLNYTLADSYQADFSSYNGHYHHNHRYYDNSYRRYDKSESDIIYTINLPMLTLAKELEKLKPKNSYVRYPLEINPLIYTKNKAQVPQEVLDLLTGEKIITKVTVGELLWGWESEALKISKDIINKIYNVSIVEDSTYGISYQSGQPRKTWKGQFSVNTGEDYSEQTNQVNYYNGRKKFGDSSYIEGTDGTVSEPHKFYDYSRSYKNIFAPDWCLGFLPLTDDSTSSGYHYDDSQEVYRVYYESWGKTLWNAEICSDNRPMTYSLPHFLHGNFHAYFDGVSPSKEKHDTKYTLDKYTGYGYEYKRRHQYNAAVNHSTYFPGTMRLFNGMIFPMVWKEEEYSLRDSYYGSTNTWNEWTINKLSNEVRKVHAAATKWIPIGCIIGGSVILLIFSIRFLVSIVRGCKTCCKHIEESTRERVVVRTVTENVSQGCSRVRDAGKQFVVTLQRNKPDADDDVTLISDANDQPTSETEEILNVA